MAANDRQVSGDHYKTEQGREHWDVVVEFKLDYFQGQITKYVMRWRDKGGVSDLEKAKHFIEKYIEVATAEALAAQADLEHALANPTGKWTIGEKDGRMVASFVGAKRSRKEVSRQKVRVVRKK